MTLVATKGRELELEFDLRLDRVDGHDPALVNVSASTPTRLLVRGISVGKTTFIAHGKGDLPDSPEKQFTVEIEVYEVKDLTRDMIWKLFAE